MGQEHGVIPVMVDWDESAGDNPYFVLDVFTSEPLQGNQLAVFVDGRPLSEGQMQRIAREMNFAETVFLLPAGEGGDAWVRIFTPWRELPFAGHPVLGAAFVVGRSKGTDVVGLETGLGLIMVALERDGDRVTFGRMQQPIPQAEPFEQQRELLHAIGVESSLLPVELYRNGPPHVYVRLPSPEAVAALTPDMAALEGLGVAADCFAGLGRSWKTRMFYPAAGIAEDPATGSAAGPLAVHLVRHGEIAYGDEIEIRQGEEVGRPSLLYAVVAGEGDRIDSVEVGGAAVIVAKGHMRIARTGPRPRTSLRSPSRG
jgi:trans-2,3-dihydro-3-hydroxyanthranilate isomerase